MTRSLRNSKLARLALCLALGALLLPATASAKRKKKKDKVAENEAMVVGQVVDVHEKVIAGARIRVTPEGQSNVVAEATADEEGNFDVKVVDPTGEYVFHLEADGYSPFNGKVPLMAGEQASIQFKLLDIATGKVQAANRAFNAGVQLFNKDDFAGAKENFLEATANNPDMPEPYQGLAEIYYREGNLEEATAAIEKFLAARPDDTNALTLAYTIYRETGDRERTDQLIDALAQTDKAKPMARQVYNDGVAAAQKGDNDTAVERFRRAAALDPTLGPAYASEATILYNVSRYEEAKAALTKLFEVDPDNKQGRRIHYLIFDALDDAAGAAESLEAYLAVDPDGAIDVMYQRADMDFRDGNREKAIAALERILELRPDMARAHYTLGLCHMSGDKAKAKAHLEKFLELAPDDPEAPSAKEMLSYL